MSKQYDFDDPDEELAFTIDFALSRQRLPARRSKTETRESIEDRRRHIARAVVGAIKRSNWRFEKGPIARGHATDWKSKPDT